MTDLLPVTLPEQVACIEREMKLRERVYPRWVAAHKMTQAKADQEMRAIRGVLETLRAMVPK